MKNDPIKPAEGLNSPFLAVVLVRSIINIRSTFSAVIVSPSSPTRFSVPKSHLRDANAPDYDAEGSSELAAGGPEDLHVQK